MPPAAATGTATATWMLDQEARAIQDRLRRVPAFAVNETMVMAAMPSPVAQAAIDRFLQQEGAELRREIDRFRAWLRGAAAEPAEMQRRFAILRVRFNLALGNFDLFSDALTQRSEADGVLLSGLDVAASDGLRVAGRPFEDPPLLCYLDRGPGGAIRRARTRLPGNRPNPVALIRVPRERMVGHGIASSLMHEVGHQGAALLGLVASLSAELQAREAAATAAERRAWALWRRWISEVIADFWSIGRVGIASTLGLIGVVSLPRWFVFRIDTEDPHPTPWLRVVLSCAIGHALYPHAQWARLRSLWTSLYPLASAAAERRTIIQELDATVPAFATLLAEHRPPSLQGRSLRQALAFDDRTPERLLALWRGARGDREGMAAMSPSLALGVCAQARLGGLVSPEDESRLLTGLLRTWAARSSLDVGALCAQGLTRRFVPPAALRARSKPVPVH